MKPSPSLRSLFNQELDKKIKELFELHRGRYGYRRLHDEFLDEGYCLSLERLRRRMYKLNLNAKQSKKYKHTTDSNHNKPVAKNILDRSFIMNKINQARVCDITCIKVNQYSLKKRQISPH